LKVKGLGGGSAAEEEEGRDGSVMGMERDLRVERRGEEKVVNWWVG